MVIKNSGNIYCFPLEFDLGFGFCRYTDHSDITPFSGRLVHVFNLVVKDDKKIPSLESIDSLEILFGPVSINKQPNTRGKGAWKLLGKVKKVDKSLPVFKTTQMALTLNKAIDWSKIGKWRKKYNFNDVGKICDYESIRSMETEWLNGMRDIETRTTMHYLILQNKKISDYYDSKKYEDRSYYIQIANTSFEKKKADQLLKKLDQ